VNELDLGLRQLVSRKKSLNH